VTNDQPATEKQLSFLAKLSKEQGLPAPHIVGRLAASQMIDQLLKAGKPVAKATVQALTLEPGYYVSPTDTVVRVMWNQTHSHQYVKTLTKGYDDLDWTWEYAPGAIKQVAKDIADGTTVKLTVEKAKELGHVWNRCMVCGHKLTTPESVTAGIGPVCIKKL
jgi:Family of unknown function (DUF6011)